MSRPEQSEGADGPRFRKSLAVVIGIDRYTNGVPELRTAVADARRLGEILQHEHEYEVRALFDEEASLAALTDLFIRELPSELGENDRLILYFAGHGVAQDGDDGPNGFLIPCDAKVGDTTTYLHMPLVHDKLLELTCRHVLVVFDSCFSGAFRWSGTRALPSLPRVIHKERYNRFLTDPAWQVISSASHDQLAVDQLTTGALGTRDDSGTHSPFALALFEALEGPGDVVPAGEGDGVITATELYLYLEEQVQPGTSEAGQRQTPRLWPLRKHGKGEFIFLVPGHELNLPPAPELTFENNPYRGLKSYEFEDEALFFGRDDEIEELRAYVEAHPLLVVVGASGTGKSSLVKAGLLPSLANAVGERWKILPVVRPGSDAAAALVAAFGVLRDEPERPPPTGLDTVLPCVKQWLADNPEERLLLVIDQLEELVTLSQSDASRDETLQWIATLLDLDRDRIRVVLTLRSDFEPSLRTPILESEWSRGRYAVPALDLEGFRDVIEGPATQRVLYFESPDLIDQLIKEVNQTPGALPLLSFTLSEMYIRYVRRESDDRALTWDDYNDLGGVLGALRTRADEEYERLGRMGLSETPEQATMRLIMLRMIAREDGQLTRRRVHRTELDYADPVRNDRVRRVIDRLTSERLLVEGVDANGNAYAEPAHDKLVDAWGRLRDWVREVDNGPVDLGFQRRLGLAASEWDQDRKKKESRGLLWRDRARAITLKAITPRNGIAPWLNRAELEFARRSIRRSATLQWIVRATGAVIVLFGVFAIAWGRIAVDNAQTADGNSAAMTAMDLAERGSVMTSRLLAVEAFRSSQSDETESALFQAVGRLPAQLVGPDTVTRSPSLAVDQERVESAAQFVGLNGQDVRSQSVGTHSVALATGDDVWVVRTPVSPDQEGLEIRFRLTLAVRTVVGLALDEAGDHLVIATAPLEAGGRALGLEQEFAPDDDGADLVVVDVARAERTLKSSQFATITGLALSGDGRLLAVSGDRGLRLFDLLSPQNDSRFVSRGNNLSALEFDPTGRAITGRNQDGLELQFAVAGRVLHSSSGAAGAIQQVTFAQDGTVLAVMAPSVGDASADARLGVWDVEANSLTQVDASAGGGVRVAGGHAAFASGEHLIHVSLDAGGIADTLDLGRALEGTAAAQTRLPPALVAVDVGGRYAAVALESGHLAVVNLQGSPPLVELVELEARPDLMSFSEDGRYLLIAGALSDTGFMESWEVEPEGTLAGRHLALFGAPITAVHAAWNDEAVLAEADGTITLWELNTNGPWYDHELREEFNTGERVADVALHPSGDWLAIAQQSHVQLWSTDSEQRLGDSLDVHAPVASVAFSPDLGYLVAGGGDGRGALRFWKFNFDDFVGQVCQAVGRNLTKWEGYVYLTWEDRAQYRCTCDTEPPARGVELDQCPPRFSLRDWLMGRAQFQQWWLTR